MNGLIIHVESFPGWENFAAFSRHITFVKEHHKKVQCVALVTDSSLAHFAEVIANHFVGTEIKEFAFGQLDEAKEWILKRAEEN